MYQENLAEQAGRSWGLQAEIEAVYGDVTAQRDSRIEQLLADFRRALNLGEVRAATFDGHWKTNAWVKKALALCLRFGYLSQAGAGMPIDLDTLPRRQLSVEDGVRVTDSTCFVRDGACVSTGCTLMPHTIIQMGAYVGPQTVVGNGVGIGVCAQVGAGVHLGSGVQINGHIEPLDGLPAIIGDGASIGANCVIGTGVIISSGTLVFPGTIVLQQTQIYDPTKQHCYVATSADPLIVPPGAIVIPGTRSLATGATKDLSLSVQVAVIAGYTTDCQVTPILENILEK